MAGVVEEVEVVSVGNAKHVNAILQGVFFGLLLICKTLTPVVLLLLVVVSELPLPLCGHASLSLHHLLCLICTGLLESLVGVVTLEVSSGRGTHAVVLAD